MTLGDQIKKRREELKISVADLAEACSVSPAAVYQWESGDVKNLRPDNLLAVADRLGVWVRWLVKNVPPKERRITRDELKADESTLVDHYRALPAELQEVVANLALTLYQQQNPGRKSGDR